MKERVRETWSGPISADYLAKQAEYGWRLASIEWEREITTQTPLVFREKVPFGLRVAADAQHLEENPEEVQALLFIMEGIVADKRLSQIAVDLNRAAIRTRSGQPWGPGEVFELLPRLIEVGPRIFSSEEWIARREQLFRAI
jgi:hypothetical protein